jgi:hypothetical protein
VTSQQNQQYLRKIGLFLTNAAGNGIDLSNMEIIFQVNQADSETPNTAKIQVYNLSDNTSKMVESEFTNVRLQAGYEGGSYGTIFEGQVAQFRRGRLDAKDSFLEMLCGDGDKAFQFAFVNASLAAGASAADKLRAVNNAVAPFGVTTGGGATPTGGVLPRGKVMFGLARDQMGPIADSSNMTWSIQNGVVTLIPQESYLPGEAVVLNSATGMIGVPEATQNGVEVECLLNPNIKIGTRVQIDNALINQTQQNQQGYPRYTDLSFFASTSQDGFYRVLVAEHKGDVRGNVWTTSLTCLVVNQSSAPASSVYPYGLPPNLPTDL